MRLPTGPYTVIQVTWQDPSISRHHGDVLVLRPGIRSHIWAWIDDNGKVWGSGGLIEAITDYRVLSSWTVPEQT